MLKNRNFEIFLQMLIFLLQTAENVTKNIVSKAHFIMNKKLFQKKTKYLKLSNGGSGLAVK
jgi:hypothetical protein